VRANQRLRHRTLPAGSWPCNTFGNHDADRTASRWNHDGHGRFRVRLTAALVLTLPGTPSLYMGEEIGMENYLARGPADLKDPIGPWYYDAAVAKLGHSPAVAADRAARFSRDRCRTPMQWDASANAGFSPDGTTPWLPVHDNHTAGVTVADQKLDPASLLSEYRRLIALRKAHPALLEGAYEELMSDHETVFAFRRLHREGNVGVYLNLSDSPSPIQAAPGEILYETGADGTDRLGPFSIRIVQESEPAKR
jgi:alpha-glucosidase